MTNASVYATFLSVGAVEAFCIALLKNGFSVGSNNNDRKLFNASSGGPVLATLIVGNIDKPKEFAELVNKILCNEINYTYLSFVIILDGFTWSKPGPPISVVNTKTSVPASEPKLKKPNLSNLRLMLPNDGIVDDEEGKIK